MFVGTLVDGVRARETAATGAEADATSDDEIEINIDQIDPRTFHDLDRYVRQCLSQSNPKKKKAAGGAEPKAKKQKA